MIKEQDIISAASSTTNEALLLLQVAGALFDAGCIDEAIELCAEATQTDTTGLAWLNKGYLEASHNKNKESIISFENAALYNQVEAKHMLGLYYTWQWQESGSRNDFNIAHKWLCEASCEGHKESQDAITHMIYGGSSIPWQKSCSAVTEMTCPVAEDNHNLLGESAGLPTNY